VRLRFACGTGVSGNGRIIALCVCVSVFLCEGERWRRANGIAWSCDGIRSACGRNAYVGRVSKVVVGESAGLTHTVK